MITILFVWTMAAAGSSGREYREWRALAEFSSLPACQRAVEVLGIKPENARCVTK
jgi:hypothetical protein